MPAFPDRMPMRLHQAAIAWKTAMVLLLP